MSRFATNDYLRKVGVVWLGSGGTRGALSALVCAPHARLSFQSW